MPDQPRLPRRDPAATPPGARLAPLGARLAPLAGELAAVVGPAHVLTGADTTARYRTDWTGRFVSRRAVVVRPGSVEDVVAVLAAALQRGVPVVPQGGNTGLVGGSVPGRGDAVVLSTERLVDLGEVDLVAGQVTVGAGVTLTRLADHLAGTGWRYAVDLGARDTATIGGTVATNAGGMRVFRFGATRQQIAGLEYVTADGSVVSRLGGILKDNTGYDLGGLIVGSEGTLAVVTRVRLRLVPARPAVATALLGFASRRAAFAAAWSVRRDGADVEVVEAMDGRCVRLVADSFGVPVPFPADTYLLVEAAAVSDPSDALAGVVAALGPAIAPTGVAVGATAARRAALWRFRDDLTVAIASHATAGASTPVLKYDVAVPSPALADFCDAVEVAVAAAFPGAEVWLFGHVCDDNIHVNVTGAGTGTGLAAEAVDDLVLDLVAAHGGSISAEHGIGRSKARLLHLSRSPAEIAQMRSIKAALDPDGLLNPGVLLTEV